MSMLAGLMGSGTTAAAGSGTAATMAGGSAASGSALSGTLGSAYAAPAASTVGFTAPAAMSSAAPSMWSQIGDTVGQFGRDYAKGYSDPMATGNVGFNAQTLGQAAKAGDSDGHDMMTSYLQKYQRQQRGY